ncbi:MULTISPECIES: hypothetical protein [unclassified Caballeronia]|uniref:hypothetical protein n=1 Tax=unclassified Caballeronia TaxID=2646786 RepID=UPI00285E8C47|nr:MULTISPECIES: hypothetical protein [unclassified Caballeronia]MDR5753762.1 hypothetical protein [Caballeronia sp. LZ024]MDR5840141.1 hypothetical protein [Caballeronia sp. LZ031]
MYPTAIDESMADRYVSDRVAQLNEPVQFQLAPFDEAAWSPLEKNRLPAAWVAGLAQSNVDGALDALGWTAQRAILPKTFQLLREKLAGLGVLMPQSEAPSLLYFFVLDDDIAAFEGLPPVEPADTQPDLPAELVSMQTVHDGWFDFFSGDLGWMPEEEWQTIGRPADEPKLIGIASKGSALVGFEADQPPVPHVLWPDDDAVESPSTLFGTIDRWVVAALSDATSQR